MSDKQKLILQSQTRVCLICRKPTSTINGGVCPMCYRKETGVKE